MCDATYDFRYDGLQHQVKAARRGGSSEIYFYDANGQRALALRKDSAGNCDRGRLWFGETEVWYDGSGAESKTLVSIAHGGAIARIENGAEIELNYTSVLGHLLLSAGADGLAKAGFNYGPFGEVLDQIGDADGHLKRFNGKDADAVSGLSYYGFRYYDPLPLTWTQADPLFRFLPELNAANPRSANLYAFSLNNPMRYVDPNGLAGKLTGDGGGAPDSGTTTQCDESGRECVTTVVGEGTVDEATRQEDEREQAWASMRRWQMERWRDSVRREANRAREAREAAAYRRFGQRFVFIKRVVETATVVYWGAIASGIAIAEGAVAVGARGLAAAESAVTSSCFAAGTPVLTADGPRPIDELHVGDLVWSQNEETRESGWRPILQTFVTRDRQLLELRMVMSNGELSTLHVTPGLPIMTRQGWVAVRDLKHGMLLRTNIGWLTVRSVTPLNGLQAVYNFEVGGFHTYFAGNAAVWVHNNCFTVRQLLTGKEVGRLSRVGLPKGAGVSIKAMLDMTVPELEAAAAAASGPGGVALRRLVKIARDAKRLLENGDL